MVNQLLRGGASILPWKSEPISSPITKSMASISPRFIVILISGKYSNLSSLSLHNLSQINEKFSIKLYEGLTLWLSRLSSSNDQKQLSFLNNWLDAHIQDAQNILRKPLLLAEFGKSSKDPGFNTYERDQLFNTVYNKIYASAKRGGVAAGSLFWQLLTNGMDSFHDGYEIIMSQSSSTTNLIAQHSHRLYQIRRIFARMRNVERWKKARAARRSQWINRNKGKRIGN